MKEKWLPKALDAASTEQPRRKIRLLHPTFRFFGPSEPLTFDSSDEWYIIENAEVHNAQSSQPKFHDEFRRDIERLRNGDNLWGVSGVTNQTHIEDVAEIREDILIRERPGLYRGIDYSGPIPPGLF